MCVVIIKGRQSYQDAVPREIMESRKWQIQKVSLRSLQGGAAAPWKLAFLILRMLSRERFVRARGGFSKMIDKKRGGKIMPTYIALFKLTDQGFKDIKNAPQRVEAAVKAVEAAGGKMKGFYATMGEYDYVTIGEWPNDETVVAFCSRTASTGNVRTTTLKAFTQEEFAAIVKKLP